MKRLYKEILFLLLLLLLLSSCGKSYSVTTVGYDGAGSIKVKDGSVYTVPSVEQAGYVLIGIIDQNKNRLSPGDTIEINADLILTYKWLEESSADDFDWKINEDQDATILRYKSDSSVVCVPKYIKGLLVTGVGDDCFKSSAITNIVLPDTLTCIGNSAFEGCSNLTAIDIPESVLTIGEEAFEDCESLSSITIPKSVTSIEYRTFRGCSSLTSVEIPESVISIGGWAFSQCSSLTSIVIPEGVGSLGWGVFTDCSSLTSIEIPESLTLLGGNAFSCCTSLTSIVIPKSVTSNGLGVFDGCSSLQTITVNKKKSDCSNFYDWFWCGCNAEVIYLPE